LVSTWSGVSRSQYYASSQRSRGAYLPVLLYQTFLEPLLPNSTYSVSLITSVVECNLAIVPDSAPTLPGLSRCWLPQLFSSSENPSSIEIKTPPKRVWSAGLPWSPCDAVAASTAYIVMDAFPFKRTTREVVARPSPEDADRKGSIETDSDDRTMLVFIELDDGSKWSRVEDGHD
jgi:hypothetical protein